MNIYKMSMSELLWLQVSVACEIQKRLADKSDLDSRFNPPFTDEGDEAEALTQDWAESRSEFSASEAEDF